MCPVEVIPMDRQELVVYLQHLVGAIPRWLASTSVQEGERLAQTQAYANLMLAFGLARLDQPEAARALLQNGRAVLGDKDAVHSLLLRSFEHRIERALAGQPHAGRLPRDLVEASRELGVEVKYFVERLWERSRILEPEYEVSVYAAWVKRTDPLTRDLLELQDLLEPNLVPPLVRRLLDQYGEGAAGPSNRTRVLHAALNVALCVGEEFAEWVLAQAVTTPAADLGEDDALWHEARLLQRGLRIAVRLGRREPAEALLDRARRALASGGEWRLFALGGLADGCFRSLKSFGPRHEVERLAEQVTLQTLRACGCATIEDFLRLATEEESLDRMRVIATAMCVLLRVAGARLSAGEFGAAQALMRAARLLLFGKRLLRVEGDRSLGACQSILAAAYVETLAETISPADFFSAVDGLLPWLRVRDAFLTASHFDVSSLDIVESIVLAVIGRDPRIGPPFRSR